MASSKKTASSEKAIPRLDRGGLLVIIILALAVIPLSLWAVSQPVSYVPKAATQSGQTGGTNRPPSLSSPFLTKTLHCVVGQVCEQLFEVTDPDGNDELSLEVNFLPPALSQNSCQQSTLPSRSTLTCSFSGIPERAGEFKLLLVMSDSGGNQVNKPFTLDIKAN